MMVTTLFAASTRYPSARCADPAVVRWRRYLNDAAGRLARADMVMSIEFPDGTATVLST